MVSVSLQRLMVSDPENIRLQRQLFVIHWYGCTQASLRIRFMDILASDFEATVLYSNAHLMAIRLYEYQMGYLTGLFGSLIAMVRVETTSSMNSLLESFEQDTDQGNQLPSSSSSSSSLMSSGIDAEFNERFECALLLLENRLRPSARWPSVIVQEGDDSRSIANSSNDNDDSSTTMNPLQNFHGNRSNLALSGTQINQVSYEPRNAAETETVSGGNVNLNSVIAIEAAINDIAFYINEAADVCAAPVIAMGNVSSDCNLSTSEATCNNNTCAISGIGR